MEYDYNKYLSTHVLFYLNNNFTNIKLLYNNKKFDKFILKCNFKKENYILKLFLNGRKDDSIIFNNIKERCKYIMYSLKKIYINNDIILIYKYYEKGDLFSYINKNNYIKVSVIRKIVLQILEVLVFLKKYNIIHIDLKAENILLDKRNNIKVIDFEHSEIIKNNNVKKLSIRGTYIYLPPESIFNNIYSLKNDYWSLGIIIFIFFTKKNFYINTYKKILDKINIHNDIKDLINGLLIYDYEKRYNINDIKNNKWIKKKSIKYKFLICFKKLFEKKINYSRI